MRVYTGTPAIDFHAHIYPETVAPRAVEGLHNYSGLKPQGKGTVSQLIERGHKAGVTQFVVQSVATTPHQVPTINSFIAATAAANECCIGFGTLHPNMEEKDLDKEIDRIEQLGLRGVKLHPDNQGVAADDPRMMRVFERLEGRLPVLIHCGDYRNDISHPRRIAAVLDAFPKLTLIAAHMGGWGVVDYAVEYLENRDCYLDLSSTIMCTGPRRAKELIHIYGADRVLYGTDYPVWDPVSAMREFLEVDLSEADRGKILYQNAVDILY